MSLFQSSDGCWRWGFIIYGLLLSVCLSNIGLLKVLIPGLLFSSSSFLLPLSLLLNPLSLGHFIHSLGFNYPYMMVTLTFIAQTSSLFRALGSYIQLANGHFHRDGLQNSAFPPLIAPIVLPSKPVSLSLVPCIGDWYPSISQGFPPLKENVLKVCLLFTTAALS